MTRTFNLCLSLVGSCFFVLFVFPAVPISAEPSDKNIVSRTAKIDNVELHYPTAGHEPTVILLHGFAETSRMWRPLIPLLAEKFTVIALGMEKAKVVGHDIGLMVAYAYATQFPAETEKLVVMDAFLPGVPGWEAIYNDPHTWHFRFNGEYPEALVKGRERTYFEYFWNVLAADKTRSIPEADRNAYTEAYSKPGRMRAAWAYFVSWPQLAKDFAKLSQKKLTMPVLSIGGEKSLGNELAQQMKLVATDVTVVVLPNTGHWILEERPQETSTQILNLPTGVAQVPLICAAVTPVSLAARIVTIEAAVKHSAQTILKRICRVVLAMEIAAAIEVMDCANVLGEEKVQCPVKCHTNLFV
jgi:pimeloyl-ACP methyl ester carboxylesterase